MQEQYVALGDALGARSAHVVLAQNLQHGCTRYAGDEGHEDKAQGNGGQDQILEPWPEATGYRRVALHWQPIEQQCEHVGEQIANDEDRH